jgi:integrase
MKKKEWTKRLKQLVTTTPYEGVWERKEGGHLVRARVLDPRTSKMREVRWVLADEPDAVNAYRVLQDEVTRIKEGEAATTQARQLFSNYAVLLLRRKLTTKEIKSAAGCERWKNTLPHLIKRTEDVRGFGDLFVDEISVQHIELWRTDVASLINANRYAPSTANGWLSILRVILKAAKREFDLPRDPAEGVRPFDTSEHVTYTEEEPNALLPDEANAFLACMREDFPQHYAMTFLGFATGLRPSSLRPLRRSGQTPDVLLDEGVILVRRSHTLGETVMGTTKTGLRQRIHLPPEVMDVLRWHVREQLETPEQKASELLFPAEDGSFRSESSLKKAFAEVRRLIGLKKRFTPKGMRRTFNDLARAAKVESLVTKSISGHQTDRMKDLYSTVSNLEKRDCISRVLGLMQQGEHPGSSGGEGGGNTPPSGGNERGTTH